MERTLREMKVDFIGNLSAPASVLVKFPFQDSNGTVHEMERSVSTYYLPFKAFNEFESYECVIMNPDFRKVNDIRALLYTYMTSEVPLAVIRGDLNKDGILDVSEITENRHTFY